MLKIWYSNINYYYYYCILLWMCLLRLVFTNANRIYDCCRCVAEYRIQIEIIVIYRICMQCAVQNTRRILKFHRPELWYLIFTYAMLEFFYPNAITKTRKLVLCIHSRPTVNIKNCMNDNLGYTLIIHLFCII
jgi:hypothetical protein